MARKSVAKESKVSESEASEGRLSAPKKGVTVRMYNTGFGDCFLLAFPADDGGAFYILIDCGVHHDYDKGNERMRLVVEDIARATGNEIDVVAITHEHADHLYGFMYAEDIFEKVLKIKDLWLAWTEDPSDPLAQKLKELYRARFNALKAAIDRLKAANSPMASSLESIMMFDLLPEGDIALRGNKDIMKTLRRWSQKKLERPENYRTPEEKPIDLQGVSGVRCYVLGPPKDMKSLKKLVGKDEMFLGLDEEMAFMAAVGAHLDKEDRGNAEAHEEEIEDEDLMVLLYPFDKSLAIPEDKAYSNGDYKDYWAFFSEYLDKEGGGWQRIDSDWLGAADQLALNINKMTNNTSLVLAFELKDSKNVLLFTGDAQIGSWLSWKGREWSIDEGQRKVTGGDLMGRAVFYKVGHHGSINATAKKNGLDLMNSKELVAMIPVDEGWAIKRGWKHPADKILDELIKKTRGRIIRSDEIPVDGMKKPPEATDAEWNKFKKNIDWDRSPEHLWIQYTVE